LIPFITSKQGRISSVSVFHYKFSNELKRNAEQYQKFSSWLARNQDIFLFEIDSSGFSTFFPMKEEMTWQYQSSKSIEIFAPFINTQQISTYIAAVIRSVFSEKYDRFLNRNIFIIESLSLEPFTLKKCIEFNVEFFEDGTFFVHFLPVSKVTGNKPASLSYIQELKRNFAKEVDNLIVSVVDLATFHRKKVDIFSLDDIKLLEPFLDKHTDSIATFDYHFLANYSPTIFGQLVRNTVKDVDESILFLEKILLSVSFPNFLNFQAKPFLKIEVEELGNNSNLRIGESKCVNKQSAVYYSGIYQTADNCMVQPVMVDNYPFDSLFSELMQRFNKGATNFVILNPIQLQSNDIPEVSNILEFRKRNPRAKLLLCIFTKHTLSSDFFTPFLTNQLIFQTYQGSLENYKLSNFVAKSLDKLGGIICTINNTCENEDTYFIGIDLGHSQNKEEQYSNLGVVFFNNNGIIIKKYVNKKIRQNERITSESICPAFLSFKAYLLKNNKKTPEKLIIHRDGKLHKQDVENIVEQAKEHLGVEQIDIVEVIKNGFPVIAGFEKNDGAYLNLKSGNCWIHNSKKYAILITNIQSDDKNAIVNPLIIKHWYGNTNFDQILNQIYWFTKVYTNNLYNSTRLPATTQKANNLVGTGKIHSASYLG
jgi:hypothetical protein